ncbi:unnamed protein product [Rotaria sp. Silwood1]|nr:unnamed protein product [Rotaria sp. Silwood1]
MSSMNVCLHEIFYYVGIDANIATEFVSGLFFGVIIGSRNYEHGQVIKVSLQTEDFRILIKSNTAIILKSCCVANIVTTRYRGRNHKVDAVFVRTVKDIKIREEEMLNEEKLQRLNATA